MMKRLLFTLLAISFTASSYAQFTITPRTNPNQLPTVAAQDSVVRLTTLNNEFRDRAKERAERLKLRHQRNFFKFQSSLTVNQTNFENWAKGDQNSFSGNAALFLNHKYSREKFYVDYSFDSKYGMNIIEGRRTKSTDYFVLNPTIGWQISKHWSYTGAIQLRSQFSNGYKYGKDKEGNDTKTLISAPMAPGTLNLSIGWTYKNKPSNENIKVQILPIGGNMTTVFHKKLAEDGKLLGGSDYAGKKIRNTFGSSLQLDVNYKFAKERLIWKFYGYVFSNYKSNTYLEFKNELNFKVAKFITLNTFVRLIHDQLADFKKGDDYVPKFFQSNYQYGIGLAYTFQNKDKKQ